MTLVHRHLHVPPGTAPEDLPLDALDDVLDRGDLDDWAPLVAAVRRDPHGELAERILSLCRAHEMYGTSRLWPELIAGLRGTRPEADVAVSLAALRRRRRRSQADVARVLGISQSDVSKIERRRDLRLSTLRRYVGALGGELQLGVRFPDGDDDGMSVTIELPTADRRDRRAPAQTVDAGGAVAADGGVTASRRGGRSGAARRRPLR